MTHNEKLARIEELEKEHFYLEMKDRWSYEDYRLSFQLRREIKELKFQLELEKEF